MDFCSSHEKMFDIVTRIDKTVTELNVKVNGSIDDIHSHIASGQTWRITIASIAAGWVVSIITLAFVLGGMNNQISINTERWNRLLERNPVVVEMETK